MNEDNENRLYAAAKFGTLEDVKAAFEACSADERKEYGYKTLCRAETNPGPHTLEIMKFLIEQGAKPDSHTITRTYVAGSHRLDIMRLLEDNENRLYAAARFGTLKDVKAAFEACSYNERKAYGYWTLLNAARNIHPCALEVVKYLIERGVEPNSNTLSHAAGNSGPYALKIVEFLMEHHDRPGCPIDIDSETLLEAARNYGPCATKIVEFLMGRGLNADLLTLFCAVSNTGPCALEIVKYLIERDIKPNSYILCEAAKNSGPFALDIVKLLIERGVDPHKRDVLDGTAFVEALNEGNTDICDYLLSRDDFYLSDLMPQLSILEIDAFEPHLEMHFKYIGDSNTYITYRGKAISRVSKLIDEKGLPYARAVAADIEKILKNEEPKPTEEDIEALQPLIKKITSKDWVNDAQVSCDDFMGCMG